MLFCYVEHNKMSYMVNFTPSPNLKTFKVLSIDGGGIKGLYSARILEHFEKQFNCHIADYFDLICGTSTGGLIALSLSLKISVKEISKLYKERGKEIFPQQNAFLITDFFPPRI